MDNVVLLSDEGQPVGVMPKAEVHSRNTPFHLAFSCYLLDEKGRVLVTRRALTKATWPGVWTNSFCGHPRPGEAIDEALHRRARQELGAKVNDARLLLPQYRYRAVDASGIVENELCPVYIGHLAGELTPDAEEVAELAWVEPERLALAVERAAFAFSPWMHTQLPQLVKLNAFD